MTSKIIRKAEINTALEILAEDVVNLMLREHQSIHQELEHVKNLIADASASLTTNFDELNKIATQQQAMLDLNMQQDVANMSSSETYNDLNVKIKKSQLAIVTALQFDDIVQQLTKHAQNRTMHIQDMFKKLAVTIEEIKKQDCEYSPEFSSKILELKQDVNKLGIELEKDNPVKQSSLTIGKTELF